MLDVWRAIKSVWSVVGALHAIWNLLFLGAMGWLLGSVVWSSKWLGAVLAIVLPVGLASILSWDGRRKAKLEPAHRLFVGSGIEFEVVKKIGDRRIPCETWMAIRGGLWLVGIAHPLARRVPAVRRRALAGLVSHQRAIGEAAGVQENWISLMLVMPGKYEESSEVSSGKSVLIVDLDRAAAIVTIGRHVPEEVRSRIKLKLR